MIKKVKLVNFQKLGTREFSFADGLNLVTGNNWSGKSSLVRAVLYALLGGRGVGIKNENLITKGEKTFSVTLELSTGQTITRGLNKVVVSADDGSPLASGGSAVNLWVEEYLGLSLQDFKAFMVSEQGEPDSLLVAGSAALSNHLNRVTGADVIDEALKWLNLERAKAEAAIAAKDELSNDISETQSQIDALLNSISDIKEKLENLRGARDEHLNGIKLWDEYKTKLEEVRKAFKYYEARKEFIDAELSALTNQLADLREVAQPVADIEDLTNRHAQLSQQLAIYLQSRATAEQYEQQIESVSARIQLLVGELAAVEDHEPSESFCAKKLELSGKVSEMSYEISKLSQAISASVCHTCRRPYDSEVSIAELKTEHEKCLALLEQLKAELKTITDKESYARALEIKSANIKNDLHNSEKHLAVLKNGFSRTGALRDPEVDEEQIRLLSNAITAYRSQASEYSLYLDRKNRLTSQISRLESELGSLTPVESIDESLIAAAEANLASFNSALRATEQEMAALGGRYQSESDMLNKLKTILSKLIERAGVLREQQIRYEAVDSLHKFLRSHKDSFMESIWNQILSYASEFIESASNGDMTEFGRNNTGFYYVEGGIEFPVECASGMQTAILGLALKLALGSALGVASPIMLLDEVTAAGSAENSATLVSLLREQAGQVILVTHRHADAATADKVIRVE